MLRELNHVGMRTADIKSAVRFFSEILGGTIIRDITVPMGRLVFVQIVDGVIELVEAKSSEEACGFTHTAFRVASPIEQCAHTLEQAGCRFTVAPKTAASGNGKLAFFKDGAGMLYELIERENDWRHDTLSNPLVSQFESIVLSVPSKHEKETRTLFGRVLGFHGTENDNRYSMKRDAVRLCVSEEEKIDLTLRFCVPSLGRVVETLSAAGCTLLPEGDNGDIIVSGPEGCRIRFFKIGNK